MKLNKKWLIGGAILAVMALLLVVKSLRGESRTEVEVVLASEQDIRPSILASGLLAYLDEVNLTAELVAKVEEILVKEGDQVEKGQLLLRLDPETYRNAIEREQASQRQGQISIERQRLALALAETRLKRGEELLGRQMIGQADFDDLRNARDLARVELRSTQESLRRAEAILSEAREQLQKTDIRAPIAGTIVALPIKVGETAIPSTMSLAGASLMKIADTSAIQAELKVDEADIARIRLGQQAEVVAAAHQDTPLQGTVAQIALAPSLEPGSQGRSYQVDVLLDVPEDLGLRSGMSARADIFLGDGGKTLAVPVEAVVTEESEDGQVKRFVWIDRDGSARKVEVETGLSDDRWEAVASGLEAGDRVIVGPAKTLRILRDGAAIDAELRDGKAKAKAKADAEDDEDEDGDASE
ncbi:RND transporter [Arenimonas soli]|uniref:RND transporter n=1 Tax=Arenimonas soli TaxID=2269504 RepID=A0ABQ1HEH8_9GAMM|nr:efflux RND transporter periplasmic adaptor subunit [Arenimonas soli]GGA72090.1 RND transporter [Arenimonas soli]